MTPYQGHRSWNAWNVSLYINNEEPLYRRALALKILRHDASGSGYAVLACQIERTPDGGQYNRLTIYEAIKDIID